VLSKRFQVSVFRFQCPKTALLTPDTWDQKVGIKDDLLPTALIYTLIETDADLFDLEGAKVEIYVINFTICVIYFPILHLFL